MLDETVTEPVRRLIAKYENRIERLEKANGRLCEQINAMPEIVRCRECKDYRSSDATCHSWQWHNWDAAIEVEPDCFCAWGERKEVTR